MNLIPILAETATDVAHSHSVAAALPHLAGMLMVMVTLAVLWGVCALTAKLIATFLPAPKGPPAPVTKPKPAPAPAVAAESTPLAATPSGITPEIAAVIAAAVATITGGSQRVVTIKLQNTAWEMAGRQSVLTSHRIR